jgi:hypothetical protein
LALVFRSPFCLPYGLWRIEMNEEDLRDCFAMFAVVGVAHKGVYEEDIDNIAKKAFMLADAMMEARKPKEKDDEEDTGIAAVVPKRSRKR